VGNSLVKILSPVGAALQHHSNGAPMGLHNFAAVHPTAYAVGYKDGAPTVLKEECLRRHNLRQQPLEDQRIIELHAASC
jgi:hypothetical protein